MKILENTRYLPSFMRDFHAQKDLFKCIFSWVLKGRDKDPSSRHCTDGLNWANTHVYVIDFFLWFMAVHGYTLQRDRRTKGEARDLHETVSSFMEELREQERAVLLTALSSTDEDAPKNADSN